MRILVAGGAGFLGSSLCRALLRQEHEVICVDNLCTGQASHITQLSKHHKFTFLQQNISDLTTNAFEPVQQIYNLACAASPPHYQRDPLATIHSNVHGTQKLLDLAQGFGARFLQASTSEVYGDPEVVPQSETYFGNVNPVGPRACYDEGKRLAETLCTIYSEHRGVDLRIARIFNTYGPGMRADDGRVVSNFIVQALAGLPLTLYGDGRQTRAFCYIDDMMNGLMTLMNTPLDSAPINLGNPQHITVAELAERILKLTQSTSSVTTLPLPQDDPKRRTPDIRRAQKHLGWQPETSLEEGLHRTIEYFRSRC